jgi:hypothetical protein
MAVMAVIVVLVFIIAIHGLVKSESWGTGSKK